MARDEFVRSDSIDSTFSVVIPTFNRSRLLTRAIESTLAQTIRPGEVIVVDDGSTDDTAAVCRKYQGRVTYLRQDNQGAAAARNTGIRLACHPWIAFLDSDDYWTVSHLERMAAAIAATWGEARFYFCDMARPAAGATLWTTIGFRPGHPFHLTRDATAWMLMKRQPAPLPCSVFKASALKDSGGFDTRFRVSEDAELFCRLGIKGPACAVSGVGGVETADDRPETRLSTLSSEETEIHWKCHAMLWQGILDRFPGLEPRYRRLVRYNAAVTYLRLTKALWHSGKVLPSFVSVLRCLRAAEPAFLGWVIRHRTASGWEFRVRPPCQET